MFDTHCHLQTESFNEDREAVLAASREAGVDRFLVPAIDHESFGATVELARSHPDVYYALGIHPHAATSWSNTIAHEIEAHAASDSKLVAVGEIGIDYHYDFAPRNIQRKAFAEQIDLAQRLRKPIIIHTRESEDDVWDIVEEHYRDADPELPRGQFHCFSAGVELMEKAVGLGFCISFTGNITFKKSTLTDVVLATPLESILLETDSPYLAPAPHRGKRNSPSNLRLIAAKIAEIKGLDISFVMKQTLENSLRLFGISSSFILLALISLLAFADIASAQRTQPVTTPPDSVLTGDRRKSEELKRRQQEELNKEAEARRIDSIRNAQREQEEVLAKAREIQRQDSARAAERIAAEERERIRMQTPMPWKAIGIGGGIGIGNMPMILGKPTLTPTSVLASTIQLSTFLTRRLDFTVSLTKMTVGDDFPGDSVYHYGFVGNTGKGTPASFKYTPSKYQPGTYLVQGEDIHISAFGIDARYAITPPSAVMQFYLGVGYSYLTMTNTQRYQLALDSIHSDNQLHEYTESFHRGAIKLLFGMRHDFELGNDFTLSPFAQISALGAFQGDDQNFAFVFAPDREQIIMTHLSVGATLYWGWFGVPRIR